MMNNKLEIEELKKLKKYTKRNKRKIEKGYPIQYLIGYVDFYGNKIIVNKNTLIPRYETEYLIEKTLKYINKLNISNPKILDLCTGTGCIGLTIKKELPSSKVTLSDISSKALRIAKKNKRNLNLNVEIIKSNLFRKVYKKYDVIISNPPYVFNNEAIPVEVTYEPKIALFSGDKGIDHIEKIFKEIKLHLNEKALVALEINEKSEKDLTKLLKIYFPGNNYTFSFEKDLAQKTRYLFIFKNL